ncbi:MAG TPA: glycerol-3-phosphate 1-O-acyltransferase PlsY [Gemmatimonadota bacterium]
MALPIGAVGVVLAAYLIGSFPTSYLAGRLLRGIDLRQEGSGNLGATNVYRALGLLPAAAVMALDVAKGFVAAALLPRAAAAAFGGGLPSAVLAVACALAAILGHVFPVWLGFRGGKGVATAVGAFLALSPLATLGAVLVWLVGVLAVRIVSVASLALGVCLPLFVFAEQRGRPDADLLVGFGALAGLFVWWTHRENLRRLARGEERPISRATKGSV